ncbi:uncharacterized protein MYCFIDRAFT_178260 [Pseudocercospora fijiensis CIRAD86]|uniref:Uncharacterized protein n=1 Tax=Pseudocercospora fijiensis (strain CIRAD86) TaxID=383855 RepID=M3ARJ7_PSEFD|nr:uncharacterized protein MYCFIDRAFT_178260 [Pseudocercospora fijiensis CIRAD86]EME79688.1 hypothetical protein MYCFIDRAFT_178260 [Pseudocercospora fijiensis CIRAD86]
MLGLGRVAGARFSIEGQDNPRLQPYTFQLPCAMHHAARGLSSGPNSMRLPNSNHIACRCAWEQSAVSSEHYIRRDATIIATGTGRLHSTDDPGPCTEHGMLVESSWYSRTVQEIMEQPSTHHVYGSGAYTLARGRLTAWRPPGVQVARPGQARIGGAVLQLHAKCTPQYCGIQKCAPCAETS